MKVLIDNQAPRFTYPDKGQDRKTVSNPRSKLIIGDFHIIHLEAETKIVSCLSLGNRCHLSSKNIMCNLPYRFKCFASLTSVVESQKAKVL